jgi:hypothetical protein
MMVLGRIPLSDQERGAIGQCRAALRASAVVSPTFLWTLVDTFADELVAHHKAAIAGRLRDLQATRKNDMLQVGEFRSKNPEFYSMDVPVAEGVNLWPSVCRALNEWLAPFGYNVQRDKSGAQIYWSWKYE